MTNRETPIEIDKEEFKKIGYRLIDTIAEFFENIKTKPVTTGESPKQLQMILGSASLPENSNSAEEILSAATQLVT